MIEVKNLYKKYGNHLAVDDISFNVNEGEIVGFLGPNGAGKSTTMNIITGYISPTSGSAAINGFDILKEPNEAKKHIGYLPEKPPLYMEMTVREYLDFVYDLKKCKLPRKEHIADICEKVKIEEQYKRLIKNLSKGFRQRVGIAQALIGDPQVLILDEPTVGLDPNQIIEIRTLIKSLSENHTVILSSHILQEIEAVCDRIIIINNGKLVANDTASNLSSMYSSDRHIKMRVAGSEEDVAKTLRGIPSVNSVISLGEKEKGIYEFSIEPKKNEDIRKVINKRLSERNWSIMSMKTAEMTLEEVFISLTHVAPTTESKEKDQQDK